MPEPANKDVLTFIVTLDRTSQRRDLENKFIVQHVPRILSEFGKKAKYFCFIRHWVSDDPYGDSIWLRFKVAAEGRDELRHGLQAYLNGLESEGVIEKVWEPKLQSDREVFGMASEVGPTDDYNSLWCCLEATSRTALDLLSLSYQGRLDVPEWVVADIWVHSFYNALGIPDFTRCPSCGSDRSLRLPRCYACGFELDVGERKKPAKGGS